MNTKNYITQLRQLISKDKLPKAFQQLQELLDGTPLLKKALLQNARFNELTHQIHLGTISYDNADVTKNQIRASLLDIISAIENPNQYTPEIQKEIEQAVVHISNSKNVVTGNISAGGNVTIGDQTIHTESDTSKRLRIWLFLLVPALAIGGTYLWYQNKINQQPLNFKVLIENHTPVKELAKPVGTLTLFYGGEPHPITNISTSDRTRFDNIPATFKNDDFRIKYQAAGFITIDTPLTYQPSTTLVVRRNNDLGILQGYIHEEGTSPLISLDSVKVAIDCCEAWTNASGKFQLEIPLKYQQEKQRVTLSKAGYHQRSFTEPIHQDINIQTYLSKK
jgi:hypothetical protein